MDKAIPEEPAAGIGDGHRITFEPMGISCRSGKNQSIMEIAAGQQIVLRSDCGGRGHCGRCLVSVHPSEQVSPLTEGETGHLTPAQLADGFRLACQASPKGPVRVSVAESVLESTAAIGKTGVGGLFSHDPEVRRIVLTARSQTAPDDPPARNFVERIQKHAGRTGVEISCPEDLDALRMLSRLQSHGDGMTLVNHARKGITAVLAGRRPRSLGIAVDIGTTTLAVYLCDLTSGTLLESASSANPQRRFGEDVISRIAFSEEKDGALPLLQHAVVAEINALTAQCVHAAGSDLQDIDEVAVVGNTTMQQVFMGIHPHGIGVAPYLPVSHGPHDFRAAELGLELNPATNVYIFPVISGFVGGDTVGAILSERPDKSDAVTLIVDIGTNGELVLGNRAGLWAASCATGPALEGAHIHCGMRAAAGAIHQLAIDPGSYRAAYEIIGRDETGPRGLCGSGIIDAVAEMRKVGLILPGGRIREGLPGVQLDEKGIGRRYVMVPAGASGTGQDIVITLKDIRQIQLAKSALFVGIKLLMKRAGVDRFDRLVLTGAFGARFSLKNAIAIGMLPPISPQVNVDIVANAAGRGAIMALLDGKLRREIIRVAQQTQVLELAGDPDFAHEFATATRFPETVRP